MIDQARLPDAHRASILLAVDPLGVVPKKTAIWEPDCVKLPLLLLFLAAAAVKYASAK